MNLPAQNDFSRKPISGAERAAAADAAEATLRLIARLPAPDGLEDRVMAGLKTAPRTARVLVWPSLFQPTTGWMRGAAAAAIVFVVAGGGWGIYSYVQPVPRGLTRCRREQARPADSQTPAPCARRRR
jgi:hypothetical protein